MGEQTARKALRPFDFRDGQVIGKLLTEAGFAVAGKSRLTIQRSLTPIRSGMREELLASPYEPELNAKGDEAIEAVVTDAESALARYRDGDRLIVPQESHLFQAVTPVLV